MRPSLWMLFRRWIGSGNYQKLILAWKWSQQQMIFMCQWFRSMKTLISWSHNIITKHAAEVTMWSFSYVWSNQNLETRFCIIFVESLYLVLYQFEYDYLKPLNKYTLCLIYWFLCSYLKCIFSFVFLVQWPSYDDFILKIQRCTN